MKYMTVIILHILAKRNITVLILPEDILTMSIFISFSTTA